MDANPETICTVIYCTAGDPPQEARATLGGGSPKRRRIWSPRSRVRSALTNPAVGLISPPRQRIESIVGTGKALLTPEHHGARAMAGLRKRILVRFLCLAACINLNHRLGRPSRAVVDYCA